MADLKKARDAARVVLQHVRASVVMVAGMRDPYADGVVDAELPPRPSDADLRTLAEVCATAATAMPNSLLEEFAGLTTPSGVRAGGSYFASAHELTVSIACAIKDYLDIILHDDEARFVRAAEPTAVASRRGKRSVSKAAPAKSVAPHLREVAKRWSDDVVYYRQLLWDIGGMAKTINVPRVRMLLDCELAQAQRYRSVLAALPVSRAAAPTPDVKKATRPNMNEFSPSTRASVMKLLRGIVKYRKTHSEAKRTAVYEHAELSGGTPQRALRVAVERNLITQDLHLTPAGVSFMRGKS